MSQKKINIWEQYNFNKKNFKSSFDYLKEQQNSFISKTKGILTLEVESKNSNDYQSMSYSLYVVCPKLGGYRKEILSVLETNLTDGYPVTIMSMGLTDKVFSFVEEKDFLDKIEEMLSIPTIRKTIENLYNQSIEQQ
jgi:hypothetical protein